MSVFCGLRPSARRATDNSKKREKVIPTDQLSFSAHPPRTTSPFLLGIM